jgi:hypothetical protein
VAAIAVYRRCEIAVMYLDVQSGHGNLINKPKCNVLNVI